MSDNQEKREKLEILNRKKIILAMRDRLKNVVLIALLFAIVFGGITFFVKYLLAQNKVYRSDSSIYVEYKRGEEEPLGWVCYTQDAWQDYTISDDFVQDVLQDVPGLTKEEYLESIEVVKLADGRVLDLAVVSKDPKRAQEINAAMLHAVDLFGATKERILYTEILISPNEGKVVLPTDRTLSAAVLGFLLGLVFALIGNYYMLLGKDEMYMTLTVGKEE